MIKWLPVSNTEMSQTHLALCLLLLVTLTFEFSFSEISTYGKAYSLENPNLEVELKNLSNDFPNPVTSNSRAKRMKLFLNANIARFRPDNDESLNNHFWPIWDFMLRQHKPPKYNPKPQSNQPKNEKTQEKGTIIRHSLRTKWKTNL